MENIIQIFIYIHAALGTIGLITGTVSLIIQKGTARHKKLGKIFMISMLISCIIALIICKLPGHENTFLFLIGLFTVYMLLSGKRSLTFKPAMKKKPGYTDYCISGSMFIISVIMIVLGAIDVYQQVSGGILYLVFGGIGLSLSLRDFNMFRTFTQQTNAWLFGHIGKMTGAFIASVTAFLVAGVKLHGLIYWLLPSALGFVYIYFYIKKIKSKELKKVAKKTVRVSLIKNDNG